MDDLNIRDEFLEIVSPPRITDLHIANWSVFHRILTLRTAAAVLVPRPLEI